MQPEFYNDKLYPLQDKVLKLLEETDNSFYLTGGTALSRAWLHHRYSDDLDFFLNYDSSFNQQVQRVFQALEGAFGNKIQRLIDTSGFHRWLLHMDEVALKLEFINDVAFRHGKPIATELFSRTDTVENIASNKLSALSRQEPKDMADLLYIEKHFAPYWPGLVEQAKQKDMSVNEIELAATIYNYPIANLQAVRWVAAPDLQECQALANELAQKILIPT
ncbi:MAG: nucleotidyl transferase AbiEii/AbiGii toxin family protein [Bacteroidia bacterium]